MNLYINPFINEFVLSQVNTLVLTFYQSIQFTYIEVYRYWNKLQIRTQLIEPYSILIILY